MLANQQTHFVSEEPKDVYEEDVPERLQDDPLVFYLRCRYKERDALLATFKESFINKKYKFERIEQELIRIAQLRSRFNISHEFYIQRLRTSRETWIQQAKTTCRNETQKVEREIVQLENKYNMESYEQLSRKRYQLNVLKRVPNIEKEDPSITSPLRTTDSLRSAEYRGSIIAPISEDHRTPTVRSTDTESSQVGPDHDFMVNITTLRKETSKSSYFRCELEKYPVNKALDGTRDNPLKHKCKLCEPDTLRYFHFPANNMDWIERAITRYNSEETGEYDYLKSANYRLWSSNFLCRQFWTGRQHGGKDDPIHARHMRSLCSYISSGACHCSYTDSISRNASSSNNFIMFMPYLHWETDSNYRQLDAITKRLTKDRQKSPSQLGENLSSVWFQVLHDVQPLPFRTSLGRYLFYAAYIYSRMDIAQDRALLETYLCKGKSPLHGRRTLDQSYYWKFEDTGPRDRNQVVYRGTESGVRRIVMVDQLWLYILDDHTIITSFPRRSGRNKPDQSAVHNTIQARLSHLRRGEINTIYDLALIIIDQCSMVFFDRTNLVDERPDVFGIFNNAIGNVSRHKVDAFDHFWRNIKYLEDLQKKDNKGIAQKYLNINPEGSLMSEAFDIIDQLHMMRRIYEEQLIIVKNFSSLLREFHDEENPAQDEMLRELKKRYEEMEKIPTGTIDQNGTMAEIPTIPKSTLYRAEALVRVIQMRLDELQDSENTIKNTSDQLESLLSLKQQQGSILEADASLKLSYDSIAQGRTIMLFTVVTIIFLPLSFMSSLFGMNASELSGPSGGIMSLRSQFTFMFPISVAIIIPTLCLAFSTKLLNAVIAAGNLISACIPLGQFVNLISLLGTTIFLLCFEYSGLYYLWRFYISKVPLIKGIRKVRNTCVHKWLKWDTNALANQRKHLSKEIELRRQLQENALFERRERNRMTHA